MPQTVKEMSAKEVGEHLYQLLDLLEDDHSLAIPTIATVLVMMTMEIAIIREKITAVFPARLSS